MPTIATVYKTGGDFTPDHVRHFIEELALFTQKWTRRQGQAPRVVCITDADPGDIPAGIEVIAMANDWPDEWAVMECFNTAAFAIDETVLFFRLDIDFIGELISMMDAVDGLGLDVIDSLG